MCRWDVRAFDLSKAKAWPTSGHGGFTNCPALARILPGECSNKQGGLAHKHLHLIGGLASQAALYTPKLVRAVLKALREQLVADGELNAVEWGIAVLSLLFQTLTRQIPS